MADLTPNAAVAAAARRGLRLYEDGKGGDGLVRATITDARRMAAREALSERKVRRMPGWFARHEVDRKPGWDTPGEETPGYVAWLLWGGDAGRRWAERKVKELDKEENVGRSNPAAHESRGTLTEADKYLADSLIDGVEEYGRYDGTVAEYVPRSAGEQGCANCIFYRGDEYPGTERCVIVEADVAPEGGCRLHVYGVIDEAAPADDAEQVMEPESLDEALEQIDESLGLGDEDEDDAEDDGGAESGMPSINISIDIDNGENHNAEGGSKNVNEGDLEIEGGPMPYRSVEHHTSRMASAEWRESGAGPNYRTLIGYASVFDMPSDDLGGFHEVIAPGAFTEVLKAGADVRLLWNHDPSTIMARTTNGSLELTEDETGLKVWARVDMADPDVARLVGKVRSGLVDQMSFAFSVDADGDEWSMGEDGYPLRTVRAVSGLYDVSAVTYPAYPRGTKVDVMERAVRSGRLAGNVAPDDPAGSPPSLGNEGEALKRLRAKARSRVAVITLNLSR